MAHSESSCFVISASDSGTGGELSPFSMAVGSGVNSVDFSLEGSVGVADALRVGWGVPFKGMGLLFVSQSVPSISYLWCFS
jgi:hypothetical protein